MKTLYICSTLEQARRIELEDLLITNNDWNVRPEKNVAYYGYKNISDLYWLFDKVIDLDCKTDKNKTFKELNDLIVQWGKDKGIVQNAKPLQQFAKTQEEVSELQEALIAQNNGLEYFINSKGKKVNTKDEIKDANGDIVVTLILQCELQGLDITECLETAYDIISKRTGKLINGQFIKDN